jgi:hypothetical protein
MFVGRTGSRSLIGVCLSLLLGLFYLTSWGPFQERLSAQQETDEIKALREINTLQKERCDAASRAVQSLFADFQAKEDVSVSELCQLERESLRAKLDYYSNPTERVAELRKATEVRQRILTITEERVDAAVKSNKAAARLSRLRIEMDQASVLFLEARIELIKHELAQKKQPK